MLTQLTAFKGYNVSKTEEGRFVVTLNSVRSPFLSFDKYSVCLDKVMKLNSTYTDRTTPKFKKLFKTTSRGATKAAPPHRTLLG